MQLNCHVGHLLGAISVSLFLSSFVKNEIFFYVTIIMVKIPKDKEGQKKFLMKALLLFTVLYACMCMAKQNYFKK